jgi:long-chain acyl-CoA synthetase
MDQPKRLFDFIYYQKNNHPQQKAFNYKPDDQWISFSTDDTINIANKVSRGLLKMGIKKGDKIGVVVYKNRPEWVFLDIGLQQIGAVNVPVYPTISSKEYEYIFNDSGISYAFVGAGDLWDKVSTAQQSVSSLKKIYTFDKVEGRPFWEEIFAEEGQAEVDKIKDTIQPEDLATLIYTSGTTGEPKGVMLTHHNISTNAMAASESLPLEPGQRALSFLPICHIFERAATYFQTYYGLNVYYTGTDNLGGEEGDIQYVKPHLFTTVPRLLEKVYEKIYAKGDGLSGVARKLFFWALNMTEDYEIDKEYAGLAKIKRKIADSVIFSKWRAALGGNIVTIISGAAPLPANIAKVFCAAGIPIREGYGLTETSPGLAIGLLEKGGAKLGYIGPTLPGVELMIDPSEGVYAEGEGEILARGPNIMMGYYNKPEATAAVFKEIDGKTWFKTGDIGRMDPGPDGRPLLKVTDRKKELLKTSGGKYVAPAPIENRFKEEFAVEQIMVVGEQKKFVSALILPNEEVLQHWCERNGIEWTGFEKAIKNQKVIKHFQAIVDKVNPEFSHIEQIKKFTLVHKEWLPIHEDGSEAELTPTMKLKRRVIRKKYEQEIEEMYT